MKSAWCPMKIIQIWSGGGSINGDAPIAGWFMSWKSQSRNGWFGGTPILGNPQLKSSIHETPRNLHWSILAASPFRDLPPTQSCGPEPFTELLGLEADACSLQNPCWLMIGWGLYYPIYWGLQQSNRGIPINQPIGILNTAQLWGFHKWGYPQMDDLQ